MREALALAWSRHLDGALGLCRRKEVRREFVRVYGQKMVVASAGRLRRDVDLPTWVRADQPRYIVRLNPNPCESCEIQKARVASCGQLAASLRLAGGGGDGRYMVERVPSGT